MSRVSDYLLLFPFVAVTLGYAPCVDCGAPACVATAREVREVRPRAGDQFLCTSLWFRRITVINARKKKSKKSITAGRLHFNKTISPLFYQGPLTRQASPRRLRLHPGCITVRDSSYFQRPLFTLSAVSIMFRVRDGSETSVRVRAVQTAEWDRSLSPVQFPRSRFMGIQLLARAKERLLRWEEFSGAATGVRFCCSSAGRLSP